MAHDNGAYVKAIEAHFQPIGCGTPIGGTFGRKPTTCGDRGICSASWDRRNRRDEALAVIAKVAG